VGRLGSDLFLVSSSGLAEGRTRTGWRSDWFPVLAGPRSRHPVRPDAAGRAGPTADPSPLVPDPTSRIAMQTCRTHFSQAESRGASLRGTAALIGAECERQGVRPPRRPSVRNHDDPVSGSAQFTTANRGTAERSPSFVTTVHPPRLKAMAAIIISTTCIGRPRPRSSA
jgi:hypothetical protein